MYRIEDSIIGFVSRICGVVGNIHSTILNISFDGLIKHKTNIKEKCEGWNHNNNPFNNLCSCIYISVSENPLSSFYTSIKITYQRAIFIVLKCASYVDTYCNVNKSVSFLP